MLKAIIFDMDGVLADSVSINRKSYRTIFEKYGAKMTNIDQKRYIGRSLAEQREMRTKESDIAEKLSFEVFREEANKQQLEYMKQELEQDPGVQALIREAKEQGIKVAVGTSSSRQRAINILELVNVYPHLDGLATCEDVEKAKPEPDIFLKAAEILHVDPKYCIVIEDAANGIEAAKKAGMKSAGKITSHHTKEELSAADMTFTDFSEITLNDLEKIFK